LLPNLRWHRVAEVLVVILLLVPFLLLPQFFRSSNALYVGIVGAMYFSALVLYWYIRRK
jgi:Na+-driven multidrug efflux pump